MIILIDNYDSFTYNLFHYLGDLGVETVVHRNDKISVGQVISAKPQAIVLSPGPKTPNEAGICLELIEKASAAIPIFGVCLGLQAIGQAFGGRVVRAPKLMHGKLSTVHHGGKGVFKDIPKDFEATRYHSLVVEKAGLPDGLQAKADAEYGNAGRGLFNQLQTDTSFIWRLWSRRQYNCLGLCRDDLADADLVVAVNHGFNAEVAQIVEQVVGEAVVVIDEDDHWALPARPAKRTASSAARNRALALFTHS